MSDFEKLHRSIDHMARLIERIPPGSWQDPTPCAEFAVKDLVDHLVGWVHIFEAAAWDTDAPRDPDHYRVQTGHAEAFRRAGHSSVSGLEEGGLDRQLLMSQARIPGSMIRDMIAMEYPGHGWDLAVATGQAYPFEDEIVEEALAAAERTISSEYRGYGEGQFRPVVPTGPEATVVERYVAFLGRDPHWQPPAQAAS